MSSESWEQRLRQPGALPAVPAVLVELRQGLHDLDVDVDRLCNAIEVDPALSGEILKIINSPLFGMARRIDSLKQAVVLLGLRRVRAIILSQSLRQSLATYNSPGFEAFRWWDRSILMAVGAASLCHRAAPQQGEEAYLAGLLADLGILILARFEPDYEKLLRQYANEPCAALCEAERDRFGFDHTELVGHVLNEWQMPPLVVEAVLGHHNDRTAEKEGPLMPAQAVYFASLMADCIVADSEAICGQVRELAASRFFMEPGELIDFINRCLASYRSTAREFGIVDITERSVPEALVRPA